LLFGDERWPNFVYDVGQTLRKSALVFVQSISWAYLLRTMSDTDQVEHAKFLSVVSMFMPSSSAATEAA
jgi:hypothetical protein